MSEVSPENPGSFWSNMDRTEFILMLAVIAAAGSVLIALFSRPLRAELPD